MKNQEICSWNANEAKAQKIPKVYSNFMYESAAIDNLRVLADLSTDIKIDVREIVEKYRILKGKFDEFTDFDNAMDRNSFALEQFTERIERYSMKALDSAIDFINQQVEKDKSFESDMYKLHQNIQHFG